MTQLFPSLNCSSPNPRTTVAPIRGPGSTGAISQRNDGTGSGATNITTKNHRSRLVRRVRHRSAIRTAGRLPAQMENCPY